MGFNEFLGGTAKEQEDVKRQFARPETVATHLQFFSEEIVTAQTNTKAELRGLGSSFILGDSSYGKLGSNNTTITTSTSGLSCDGNGAHLETYQDSPFDISGTQMTIECWAYPTTSSASARGIVSKFYDGINRAWEIYTVNGRIYFDVAFADSNTDHLASGTYSINNWYNIAAVYDGSRVILFLNGTEVDRTTYNNGSIRTNNATVKIGKGAQNAVEPYAFAGNIDEVRIWSTALSASEISSKYNSALGSYGFGAETNLLAGWHLDEGTGSIASAYTGGISAGSLLSGATWTTGQVSSGNLILVNPQPYLGAAGVGAFSEVVNQNPGSPFINRGLTNVRDWMLGSASAFTPANIQLGSGTAVWAATQSGLQFQTASLTANRYGEGNQLGSFQVTVSSVNRTGNGSYREMGIGSGTVGMMRDTFPLVYLGEAGSEARFTQTFRIGS